MPFTPRKEKLFRDPVHDLIAFNASDPGDALLLALIDTAEFQRLRRIRQLGMAYLAFPGAEHSRFGHGLGALHLARRMLEELGKHAPLDALKSLACLCAALLHDIGHAPFSHILDDLNGASHEERSVDLTLDADGEVGARMAAFDPALPEMVSRMIVGAPGTGIYGAIVSGQLDADRMDYLLRDSLMTGVKYGIFDLERMLRMLRLDEAGQRIVLSSKALMPLENYLQSRYHMYRQVYFHKSVTAAEVMLKNLLRRAAQLALKGDSAALPAISAPVVEMLLRPRSLKLADFLTLDDAELLYHIKRWSHSSDATLADLSGRLLQRRLFKTLDLSHIDAPLDARLDQARAAVERAGLDPRFYFYREESSDTPYLPYDPKSPRQGGSILVEDAGGGPARPAEAASPTIHAFSHGAYTLTRIVFPESANGVNLRSEMIRIFRT